MRGLSIRAGLARFRGRDIELKTAGELTAMRTAGALVAKTLAAVAELAKPGVSTGELDVLAEHTIREAGGVPSFLGYHGYPASICTSVNAEVVHGIPSPARLLADGDLLTVDCGAIVDGWHGDAAVTIEVGAVSEAGPRPVCRLPGRTGCRADGGPPVRPADRHLTRRADRGAGGRRAGRAGVRDRRRLRRARDRQLDAHGPVRAERGSAGTRPAAAPGAWCWPSSRC